MSQPPNDDDGTKAQIIEANFGKQNRIANRTPKSASSSNYDRVIASSPTYSTASEGEFEGSVPRSVEERLRRQSTLEQHTELAHDIQKDIIAFFSSSALLTTYMSVWAKLFLGSVAISVFLTFLFGGLLLTEVYERTIQVIVNDGSVCQNYHYEDPKSSTMWYNVALIFVANVFMVWYSLRGVALEKWGTSVCFIIAALTSVARIIYTVSSGLLEAYMVPIGLKSTCVGGLIAGAVVTFVSLGLLYKSLRGFGWRNYVKGATTPAQVKQINKYQVLDLFLKLDVMLCIHTIVSLFFAVENMAMFIISAIVIAITVGMLILVTYFIKKQITWFVYAFVAMCPAMPILYIYLIVAQSIQESSKCLDDTLVPCLAGYNISVGYSNYSDASLASHTLPAREGMGDQHEWFLLPVGCQPRFTLCGNESQYSVTDCCGRYGRCQYTQDFFRTDQALLIMLAVAGVIVRVFTMVFSYKRMKEMDISAIRELIERGERNMRSFALIFVRQDSASGGKRQGGDGSNNGSPTGTEKLDAVLMEDA